MECIFCRIVARTAPATIIYEDDEIIAFDDLYPKAPQHKLIIPKKHIATANDFTEQEAGLLAKMMLTAQALAKSLEIAQSGYRLLINCNQDGRQVVYHLHLHLIGGRLLSNQV